MTSKFKFIELLQLIVIPRVMHEIIFQVELLGKKYEEKYKQVRDIASKLTIEEATNRDIQV